MIMLKRNEAFEWLTKGALLVFLCVLFGYGPDQSWVFIPAEILFVAVFGVRFIIKRYKVSLFAIWSLVFFFLGALTLLYTPDKSMTLTRVKSLLQVLVFANLLMPYLLESREKYHTFLISSLLASVFLVAKLLFSAPLRVVMQQRLGLTAQVGPNTVGYIFSIVAVIAFFLFLKQRKWWWVLVSIAFTSLSFLSGSKKVVLFIGVGIFLLVLLNQRTLKGAILLGILCLVVIAIFTALLFIWEPLYQFLGSRIIGMISVLRGTGVEESTNIRLDMIQEGWALFLQKPLFGWGLGAFTVLSKWNMYSHNNYTELLVSVGLIGTIAYYFLYVYLIVKGLQLLKTGKERSYYILAISILVAMLFDGIGRVPYNEEISNILLALCYAGVMIEYPQKGLDLFEIGGRVKTFFKNPSQFLHRSSRAQ